MGKNKSLRKVIRGLEAHILEHEERIRNEALKPHPNESWIAGWQREIKTAEGRIERLKRRFGKER